MEVRELARRKRLTIEEAGRVARYDFFKRVARRRRAQVIAVAHTADDQVETVVMNWLRGAGVRGLAGMREWQPPAQRASRPGGGNIWRPLLRVRKEELRQLARTLHFGCREDHTNRQVTYTRNRIRHRLLPAMERVNPQVREVILRNAENLAELENWLDAQLVQARRAIKLRRGQKGVHWRLAPFLKLHPYLQGELLLEAVGKLQGDRQNYKSVHVSEMRKVIDSRCPRSFKQLPGKLFLIKAYDKISVSRFKPSSL
jgi:tRNA(Ile)-lysidine synthase